MPNGKFVSILFPAEITEKIPVHLDPKFFFFRPGVSPSKQIREKKYADPYKQSGKKIILMGIDFDTEKLNVGSGKQRIFKTHNL
ncbi:MAG: PD-(D/E)XK nuclease domain-containing protein [Desulfococcaceae bacterium]